MKWEDKSILKGKDTVVTMTPEMLEEMKKQDIEDAKKREEAELRVLEFHRRKEAKQKRLSQQSVRKNK